ncbi:nodulation receptor kinase-like [Impatiens glandulifera]|uniref:nodulation receptor kinase-like n=1 Tax=Impatiens glandulifera TaxID=253017 RepID=UPI001FB13E78|nr:nodulation receptor kinase-like [Impatiens glandulifera]
MKAKNTGMYKVRTKIHLGFLSIDCCAESNFTDHRTNISWIEDYSWFPDRSTCQKIITSEKTQRLCDNSRVFTSRYGNIWCYSLPTVKNQVYIIRGTFLPWNRQVAERGSSFDILIGVTSIAKVVNTTKETEAEGIFRATSDNTNFCLVKEQGYPYISKLELRPLDITLYLTPESSRVLKLIHRVNVGSSTTEIRYPDDPYDRIWRAMSNTNQAEKWVSSVIINMDNDIRTAPPIQVLQTAQVHEENLVILHNDLETKNRSYDLYLYFLEHNKSIQKGQRVFDVYINNEKRQEIDIKAGGSNYKAVVLPFTADGFFNLTLTKASSDSPFGPILNAYEILQVRPLSEETLKEDVEAILKVKKELLKNNNGNNILNTWNGDPCLPVPWKGLSCNQSGNDSTITKLNLSFSKLQGPLPLAIAQLINLKELNLSNNDFTGVIQPFLYSSITSVDVSNNNINGAIPETFKSLPYVKTINRLSKGQELSKSEETGTNEVVTEKTSTPQFTKVLVIGTVAGGSFTLTALVIIFACCYKRKLKDARAFDEKGCQMTKSVIFSIPSMDDFVLEPIHIRNFTLEYIEMATKNYSILVGEGGFGSVFRGALLDGQEVAVKVRSDTSAQGTREFNNELELLSSIQHENLVPLLGYCCEKDQQILVYPFMSNGSLQDRLYGEAAKRRTLDWPTRLSIALGAAQGLTYLHTFARRSLIHRDIKSSNILLDQSMSAKVADFGFSKYAPQEGDSGASLEVRGTAGYLDPEYYSTQHLTAKSDVFSYGVVLLEIISGREPLNIHRSRNEWSLVEWAKQNIRNSRIEEIVDPSIKGGYHSEAMWRVVEVALACIEPYSAYRPCMADVVRELEDALIIENNASEYMKSISSFGGSNRFSMERTNALQQIAGPSEISSVAIQPTPPQPR